MPLLHIYIYILIDSFLETIQINLYLLQVDQHIYVRGMASCSHGAQQAASQSVKSTLLKRTEACRKVRKCHWNKTRRRETGWGIAVRGGRWRRWRRSVKGIRCGSQCVKRGISMRGREDLEEEEEDQPFSFTAEDLRSLWGGITWKKMDSSKCSKNKS